MSDLTTTPTDGDGSDMVIQMEGNANYVTSDIFTNDSLRINTDSIYDVSGNAASDSIYKALGGLVSPYVLTVSQIGTATIRVKFSESMQDTGATNINNYCLTDSSTVPSNANIDGACGGTPIDITAVTQVDGSTFDLTTASQPVGSTVYYVYVDFDAVKDLNDNTTMVDPTFSSFTGSEPPELQSAASTGTNTILLTFSKSMKSGTSCNGVENTANYEVACPTGALTITSALQQADPQKLLLTHTESQGVGYCSVIVSTGTNDVNGSCNSGSADGLKDSVFDLTLADSPKDRFNFEGAGGQIETPADGSLFTDPFADGTSFAFSFIYGDKVYLGPNENNSGVFRFDPDGKNAVSVTFVNPGADHFGTNLTRPSKTITAPAEFVRYYFPVGVDLSSFSAGHSIEISSCANGNNDRTTTMNTPRSRATWYLAV